MSVIYSLVKAFRNILNVLRVDSLTFIFLRNLETMQEGTVGVGRAHVEEILNDPDLRSFYQQYKMERQQDLQESLSFLSDDN